jgi:hypothetical protein
MRSKFVPIIALAAALCLIVAGESNGQSSVTYTAVEAAKHVNESATVRDTVENIHQSGKGNVFLNLGGHYPNQAVTAYIPSSSASNFSDVKKYEGKRVSVTGKIALYKGKPEIVVTSPSQISIEP